MKKSRFTEEQIVLALKQAELGTSVPESAVSWVFPMPRSIHGARDTAGFRPQN
ncbi:transposase IS3/IS911 family protein [Klebsiella pneumoniae]|nr:transposase IS3/IS911 family protein [Klebsiella pneumoniae]